MEENKNEIIDGEQVKIVEDTREDLKDFLSQAQEIDNL